MIIQHSSSHIQLINYVLPVQEDSARRQAFEVSVVATFAFCFPFAAVVVVAAAAAEVIVVDVAAAVVGRLAAVEVASGVWDPGAGEV